MEKNGDHEDSRDSDDSSAQDKSGISIDWNKFKHFFNSKNIVVLITILMILIPVILTIYIRVLPQNLPATDAWAENSVNNYYANTISQQVNAQYPNLPVQQKQKLIDEELIKFKAENKDQISQQITQTSEYFKTGFRYEENGNIYTFLGDLDSYQWLRLARNLDAKGMVCDEVRDGDCIDNHMLAPLGLGGAAPSMHIYATVYLHKILNVFDKKINLMQAQFYLPTLVAVIAAIAAFFIGRRLMNNTAGFFAAMFIAVSPLFVTRTLGSDTDVWNIAFPLVIAWIFIEAFESKIFWKKAVLTIVTGLFLGLFSFAWTGWWYIFDFILIAALGYLVFELIKNYLKHKSFGKHFMEMKYDVLLIVIIIISTALFVSIFSSFDTFTSAFTSPTQLASGLKIAAHSNLWPNVYTTVAELNEANISMVVSQVSFGMNLLFSLALLGTIFMLVKRKPDTKDIIMIIVAAIIYLYLISNSALNMNIYIYLVILILPILAQVILLLRQHDSTVDVKPAFLMTIWLIGMIFSSLKGVRFILLLIPAFSIALAVAIGYLHQYLSRISHSELHINEKLSKIFVFIVLALLLLGPVNAGISAGKNFVPSITKGWWDSLTKIREESKPDAIINSWWDFGHWFKYVADRRVTLDGATQNHPNAHWLGKILQSDNETVSVAVLRMLDCGSNNGFEEINKKYSDTEKSHNVVSKIILMSKSDATKYLIDLGFSAEETQNILKNTHCIPPENYFITSGDMVGKAGVWAHFGLWDLDRAFIINEVRPKSLNEGKLLLIERFNYSDDEATRIYYDVQGLQTDREMNDWIAPWPSYASGSAIGCGNVSDAVVCDLNMAIGNNGQATIVIERAIVNLTLPKASYIVIGAYVNGARVQQDIGSFSKLIIYDSEPGEIHRYQSQNSTIGLSMLLNINNVGNVSTYSALLADPLLAESLFTKLFYLDGKNTNHFKKFSDVTDITGTRIIIWKVDWPKSYLVDNE